MADETSPNPRGPQPPTHDPDLGELGYSAGRSLIESLADVVDDARQIAVDLGARPKTVHAVRVRWSGGEIGRGEPLVVADVALLPTPKVSESGLDRPLSSGGAQERGDVVLTGVSTRYTEDELAIYLAAAGVEAHEAFFEIRLDERDGSTTRRRYTLAKPPERRLFDWRVTLRRQDTDRARSGAPRPDRAARW